jgi:hypothetical protein
MRQHPMPPSLAWDRFSVRRRLWVSPDYHPLNWRGWVDWGVGVGDMGAHLMDHSMWALDSATHDRNRRDAVQRRVLSARDDVDPTFRRGAASRQ